MFSKPRLILKWIKYFLLSSNRRGHGIHSPFVYQFTREILMDRHPYDAFSKIETLRKKLTRDKRIISVVDSGAGTHGRTRPENSVSDIANRSLSTRKFGRLLYRLSNYYKPGWIIELGSSLGISAAYLASGSENTKVLTIEGDPSIAAIANENLKELGLGHVRIINGNFDDLLPGILKDNPPANLVFIDGNHRKEPLLDYFEQFMGHVDSPALIIIHDIHWSTEMEEAWAIIQADERVKLSIDIFSAGLLFFRDELKVRQKFVIRF
jgi:predicted O-methyltransferase YrrM